jgi:hypothetical protein
MFVISFFIGIQFLWLGLGGGGGEVWVVWGWGVMWVGVGVRVGDYQFKKSAALIYKCAK